MISNALKQLPTQSNHTDADDFDLGRLKRMGIEQPSQCLLVSPKEYRDYTSPSSVLNQSMIGGYSCLRLSLIRRRCYDKYKQETFSFRDTIRVQLELMDSQSRKIYAGVFGVVFPWLKHPINKPVTVYAHVDMLGNFFKLDNPLIIDDADVGRVVPVYKGKTGQVKGELVTQGVQANLHLKEESAYLMLAELGLRESEFSKYSCFTHPSLLLNDLHQPATLADGLRAQDEAKKLTALSVVRKARFSQTKQPVAKSSIAISKNTIDALIEQVGFALTQDQLRSISEIVDDIRSPYPMRRLLSGDVGTGKSLVFMIPAVAAFKLGAKVGIVVPSQLLVTQISNELEQFFGKDLCVSRVTTGCKITSNIAVGTTALLNAANKQKIKFDFVIVDEQHKFSVGQRADLLGQNTNFLESTATAIPRTLALVNYGGMDLSVLRQSPVEKSIRSRIVTHDQEDRLFDFVERNFEKDSQVAVILPLVSEQTDMVKKDRLQSIESATFFWKKHFPHRRVGVLTGRMSAQEKDEIIAKMHSKEIDLLISTVVIETGVTLPSLKSLVVIHPERFGASQLHQLRGRVARKGGQGYFLMYCPNPVDESAGERLDLLLKHTNGFDIAESDMALRGFGDIEVNEGDDTQTGATSLLFKGVRIFQKDIEAAMEKDKAIG